MIAQTALVAAVWVRLYVVRIGEMRRRSIDPQRVADSRVAAGVLENVATADNFRNLFEVPVLFFAGCLAAAVADAVTPLLLGFAWAFVVLRATHSVIHVTYNRVMHRFAVYALGTLCVFALWTTLAFSLLARAS
jgi:hypothetical protein